MLSVSDNVVTLTSVKNTKAVLSTVNFEVESGRVQLLKVRKPDWQRSIVRMPPKLRPRWQLPPADHNYAKPLTHLPVYGENSWPVILTGPEDIFGKVAKQPDLKPMKEDTNKTDNDQEANVKVVRKRNRPVSDIMNKEQTEGPSSKRRRRKFFKGTTYEPKRKRKRRTTISGMRNNTSVPTASQQNDQSFNDSGISVDMGDSIKAELDQNTNSLKINQNELSLTEGAILLQPSADADAPGLYNLSVAKPIDSNPCTTQPVKMKRICSSCTTECQWGRKRCPSLQPESDSRRQSERLIKMNYKFPFKNLPDVCKLKIFSYLSLNEKGVASQVCVEWNRLTKSPGLWSHINFSLFNSTGLAMKSKQCRTTKVTPTTPFHGPYPWLSNYIEYDDYKIRINKFLTYMEDIKPKLRNLSFTYDVGQPKDEWLKWILALLNSAQCLDLTYANMDWTWTPLRLSCSDRYCCLFNKMQIKYRMHETRVRSFNKLQEVLAKVAPKLSHLKTPFDWSPRSVLLLCRLKQVTTLQLGQYMMLKGVQQEMIDTLLRNMPQLKELEIKICSPYYNNTSTYAIRHPGLELLDVSMCKGFFLHELKCPKLTVLKLGRYPWKGPIVNKATNKLPCVYALCRRGAPRLAYINRHHIQAYWVEFLYDELNTVLCKVCSCKDHLYREMSTIRTEPNAEDQGENVDNENVQQGDMLQIPHQVKEAPINLIPHNAANILQNVDPPLANIVPLFPILDEDNVTAGTSYQDDKPGANTSGATKYVVDDAVPSTSRDPRAQGKSCAKFKAKRSKSLPVPFTSNSEDENNDEDDQDIPIEHSTVEVRSTPRVNTVPFIGAPTHVAVIPIRVVDPGTLPQSPTISTVPISIQSIALQPQVIAVDKVTGTHVVSGPLTVVKHVIQVVPKAIPAATTTNTLNEPTAGTDSQVNVVSVHSDLHSAVTTHNAPDGDSSHLEFSALDSESKPFVEVASDFNAEKKSVREDIATVSNATNEPVANVTPGSVPVPPSDNMEGPITDLFDELDKTKSNDQVDACSTVASPKIGGTPAELSTSESSSDTDEIPKANCETD